MSTGDRLIAWLYEKPVAILTKRKSAIALKYTDAAFEGWERNQPVLSCALPLGTGRLDATAFIDGLLPEGDVRRLLAEHRRLPVHDLFGLISSYGRDVAGAVQFLPVGDEPDGSRFDIEPLVQAKLEELVAGLDSNPLAIVEESELSLPGMQDKMLLVALDGGGWGRPLGGRPSTHILKRDHPRHVGIVAAECEALALARYAGLTTVNAHVEHIAGYDCLLVERFDRVLENGVVIGRIHQEDACQALGLPATRKYEVRNGGGGPELSQVAKLLDTHADDPIEQLDRLAAIATFTALIGNADAHGKNIAFLVLPTGRIELAPIYDTVPTVLWPKLQSEAAMSIGGAFSLSGVAPSTIEREAKLWRHSPTSARQSAERCAESLLEALEHDIIDPAGVLANHVSASGRKFLEAG